MQVQVLGASGVVGQRAVASLEGAQVTTVVIQRDGAARVVAHLPLLVTATPDEEVRATILAIARGGGDLVDVGRDPQHLAWIHEQVAPEAARAGGRVVAGAGLRWAIGDLLVAVAAEEIAAVDDVHVAYLTDAGPRGVTPGERAAHLNGLGVPSLARVDGAMVAEPPGAARRLAWFPRPVGPSHAAGVPGGEAHSVPLHRPEARTVRTYEAMPGWRAEWRQAEANLATTGWGQRLLHRWYGRTRVVAGPAALAARRWGCVVEVTEGRTLVRAWAYGRDPIQLTAEIGALLATSLTGRGERDHPTPAPGAVAASQAAPARWLLDQLAVRTDLRWSRSTVELPTR